MTVQGSKTVNLIIDQINEAEFYFRLGMEASGNTKLTTIIDHLLRHLVDYPHSQLLELNNILTKVLAAQENTNWIELADLLQYELIPYMEVDLKI